MEGTEVASRYMYIQHKSAVSLSPCQNVTGMSALILAP